jgi:hypothetical protein
MSRTARIDVPSSVLDANVVAITRPIGTDMDAHQRSRHLAEGMVRVWTDATAAEPWHAAPERFGDDPMIGVIGAILDVALSRGTCADANERLVRTAAAQGDQRRLQGIEEGRLLGEYESLTTALRNRVRDTAPTGEVWSAVMRLDHVLWLARSAATQGYHRSDRAAIPSWSTQLESQIAACSASLANLFPHADTEPVPAYANGSASGVGAVHLSENGSTARAALETVPDLHVDSLPA